MNEDPFIYLFIIKAQSKDASLAPDMSDVRYPIYLY